MSVVTHFSFPAKTMRTCRLTFLIAGFCMGAWAPLVPFARARAGIDDGQLGLLLLCLGFGSMVMMPVAGLLTARLGCRFSMCLACALICGVLPFLATVSSFSTLVVCLILFGAGIGIADVTMNIQGVIVERATGRSLMSGFHGLFSLGSIISAFSISVLLWLGTSPLQATLAVVLLIVSLMSLYARHMLPYGAHEGGPMFTRPSGLILFLGVLCFIAFLVEGSMLDWSAVFLSTVKQVDASRAGIGYALFSMAMALGRLNGDRIIRQLGQKKVLMLGACIAIVGFAMAVFLVPWPWALLGFILVGIGISNMVPVFCSLAGAHSGAAAGLAIATLTTIGYLGILMGPALIGFVAQISSLSAAFLGVAGLLLVIMISARRIVR